LSRAAEFARFRKISTFLQNVAGFWSGSGGRRKQITTHGHYCAMKYMTATRALMGGILKILNLIQGICRVCGRIPYWLVWMYFC